MSAEGQCYLGAGLSSIDRDHSQESLEHSLTYYRSLLMYALGSCFDS